MMGDKQALSQRGGDGSQQIQVAGDLVVQGVTEERARQIALEAVNSVLEQYSSEAKELGRIRAERFEAMAVPVLASDGSLEAFRDPGFQFFLRQVNEQAISTDDEADHEILTRLLAERARSDAKRIRLAVGRAVEIVDRLDESAVRKLSACWVVIGLRRADAWSITDATRRLDEIVRPLFVEPVNGGDYRWLDDLELLDCVRVLRAGIAKTIPFVDILAKSNPGVFSEGVRSDDADFEAMRVELAAKHPGLDQFVGPHQLLDDRLVFKAASLKKLNEWIDANPPLMPFKADLVKLAKRAGIDTVSDEAKAAARKFIAKERPSLAQAVRIWDLSPHAFELTSVGRALAYSNLKRFDSLTGLPPLSEYLDA